MTSGVSGYLINALNRTIRGVEIEIGGNGIIERIRHCQHPDEVFIIPCFVDSQVHIETSMLIPASFASAAITHGVAGAVVSVQEIANRMGINGIKIMLDSANQTPFVFGFGAPSRVPFFKYDSSGIKISPEDIMKLLKHPAVTHLSEAPSANDVISGEKDILANIKAAADCGKPVDGYAPGLAGAFLKKYIDMGVTSDYDSLSTEEASEKIRRGMCIHIRSASLSSGFVSLLSLINQYPDACMLCSGGKLPDELMCGYINEMAAEAYRQNTSVYSIIKAACINPVLRYKLPIGLLKVGDPADFQILRDLSSFVPEKVYLHGKLAANNGVSLIPRSEIPETGQFRMEPLEPDELKLPAKPGSSINVIHTVRNSFLTKCVSMSSKIENGFAVADKKNGILKIAAINECRREAPPAVGFASGFGPLDGAIAFSVAHGTRSLLVIGSDDYAMAEAANKVIQNHGGLAVTDGSGSITASLALPIAGFMSNNDVEVVAKGYNDCKTAAKNAGVELDTPFVSLSFMSMPVFPDIRITGEGLFNVRTAEFLPAVSH